METRDLHYRKRWQFSLRTLLFLMSIVALCSMLIGVSAVLAIVIVPFFVFALVRTLRINAPATDEEHIARQRRGLMATFCASLVLILTLLAVSFATVVFALMAASLVVLDLVARYCKPIVANLQPVFRRAWWIAVRTGRAVASLASYSNIQRFLNWSSGNAMLATRYLVAATGILHRRCWHLNFSTPETSRSK
jgi:hypothetical protein